MNLITATGRRIDPSNPQPSDISVTDIALGLAKEERFDGNTFVPYSVAQHSCLVADLVAAGWGGCRPTEELVKAGLLHDASEAYIGDIVQPLKRLMPDYVKLEEKWTSAIFRRFGIDPGLVHHFQVKSSDKTAFVCECGLLVANPLDYELSRADCEARFSSALQFTDSVNDLSPDRVFDRKKSATEFFRVAHLLGIA